MSTIHETTIALEDFQPGDGTRYMFFAVELPPYADGVGDEGGYLVGQLNGKQHNLVVPKFGYLEGSYLLERWPGSNPWTIRAFLEWLGREPFVDVTAAPVPSVVDVQEGRASL